MDSRLCGSKYEKHLRSIMKDSIEGSAQVSREDRDRG